MKTLLLSSAAMAALALAPAAAQSVSTTDDVAQRTPDAAAQTTTDQATTDASTADEYFGADQQADPMAADPMTTGTPAVTADETYDPSFGTDEDGALNAQTDIDTDTDTDFMSDESGMAMQDAPVTPLNEPDAELGTEVAADDLNSQELQREPRLTTTTQPADPQLADPMTATAPAMAMAGEDGTVTVTIDGVEADGGEVYVALQTRDGFAQVGGEYAQTATADASSIDVTFEGVAPGEYAVAVFQDTDGDGSVTLGEAGPTEPWGFSGDVFGVPSFENAMVMVQGDTDASVSLSGDAMATAMADPMADETADPMAAQPAKSRMAGTLSGQPTEGMEAVPQELALIYRNAAALTPTAVTAKDFLDGELVSPEGEELAEVKDVIIDSQGQARGVILATGGLFGLGRDYYAVDFDRVLAVRMEDGTAQLQSALTEEDVERLREFDLEAFEADMGSLMLASELRDKDLPIGQTDEMVRVDDVIMSRSGAVEALVVEYDGDSFVAPFSELGVAQGDGGFFINTTPELIGAMAVFEGRQPTAINPAN